MLARIVYRRHWWFPLVREPLIMGMRFLARWNHIDARSHAVRNHECKGCIRFMKTDLEQMSPTFRFINSLIGDRFNNLRNSLLTQAELDDAKRFAKDVMGHANGE